MRIRSKTLYGRIDPKSGEPSIRWDEFDEFCSLHKGERLIIRVDLQPKEPSERTINYWYGYIVKEMQGCFLENGERLSLSQVDYRLRSLCPLFLEEKREKGTWKVRVKEFDEVDQAIANEAIEWVFQYASENYYKILDNPL